MGRATGRVLLWCTVFAAAVSAQQPSSRRLPGAMSSEEATLLVNAYALLAQGEFRQANEKADEARGRFPRSIAVLTMVVDVRIAWGGAKAGLDVYEGWLGARTLEEPALLRTIAVASLREFAGQTQDGLARDAALWALIDDGDTDAQRQAFDVALTGDTGAIRRLAARGDVGAIQSLLKNFNAPAPRTPPNLHATIVSLGDSRSPLVIEPLVRKLTDPDAGIRGTAAEALGKVGGAAVIGHLRPLLSDPGDNTGFVRARAAGALYRLNDLSGIQILRELAESDNPKARLAAVELMASHPDPAWLSLVRGLLNEPDSASESASSVRLSAAKLLAAHDPAAAAGALERLSIDANPAIREEATRLVASDLRTPVPTLRRLLRHQDWLTRVNAAASITTLTR